MYSHEPQSEATLRFVGSEVRWVGTRGSDRGLASIFIDGGFQAKVDQYSEDRKVLQVLFSMNGLPHGPRSDHRYCRTGLSRTEKSSGERVDVDACRRQRNRVRLC